MNLESYIAATRFGYGVTPNGEGKGRESFVRQWEEPDFFDYTDTSNAAPIVAEYLSHQAQARASRQNNETAPTQSRKNLVKLYQDGVQVRFTQSLTTKTPFFERMVHFWSNHFAIDAKPLVLRALAADYENTAIRPHITGLFSELLEAAVLHPAMLIYLDQATSLGPNSPSAARGKKAREARGVKAGLNENLAREVLELHTLGVNGGYTQRDVEELARALTGHSVAGYFQKADALQASQGVPVGSPIFIAAMHEPGERTLLGRRYPASGAEQLRAMLRVLAMEPATARFLATKLARHFIADDPPKKLVERLADAYLNSGGELSALYTALLQSPDAWQAKAQKFKSPWDWSVSALRALGLTDAGKGQVARLLDNLGQSIWLPGSPAGFGDDFEQWGSADALARRVALVEGFVARAGPAAVQRDPLTELFPPSTLPPASMIALKGAESPAMRWALALILPEFQRR